MGKIIEYYDRGMELIGKGLRVPRPFYKAIGMEKLVESSEKFLGEIDEDTRTEVAGGYTFATALLGAGMATGDKFYCIASGLMYGISILHHSAMSDIFKSKKAKTRENSEYKLFFD